MENMEFLKALLANLNAKINAKMDATQEKIDTTQEKIDTEMEARSNEEAAQGPASSCRATWRAKGTDPRRLWIPEYVGYHL
jgi:hypothetical protein